MGQHIATVTESIANVAAVEAESAVEQLLQAGIWGESTVGERVIENFLTDAGISTTAVVESAVEVPMVIQSVAEIDASLGVVETATAEALDAALVVHRWTRTTANRVKSGEVARQTEYVSLKATRREAMPKSCVVGSKVAIFEGNARRPVEKWSFTTYGWKQV